jgi:exodeoxyribonuclease V alpha subunit
MAEPRNDSLIDLVGEVEHITFRDDTSAFTIAQVRTAEQGAAVAVVGPMSHPIPGVMITAKGRWTDHPRFGRQFKAVQIESRPPVTLDGIEKYLGSGMIRGIGPEMARRIVDRFKEETLDIIDHHISRLAEVPGIGAKRVAIIAEAWQAEQDIRHIMLFLQSHGAGPSHAQKIYRQYGERTIAMVRRNPYRLARDIFGIGFRIADGIAAKLGFENDAPLRLQAGILYVLNQLADKGHLYYPYETLLSECRSILKSLRPPLEEAMEALAKEKKIVIDVPSDSSEPSPPGTGAVYLSQYYQCERFIARQLHLLLTAPYSPATIAKRKAVDWVQSHLNLNLARSQQDAIAMAMTSKVLVITGGPGTGKTTIVRAITRLYEHLRAQILLAAPTGRAAKRLEDATGRPAKTIHRLLEYNPGLGGFQRDRHNPLDGDLLVVDEASMIDAVLMYHLLCAVPVTATLILVGDVHQLPSVGPGNILKDILASNAIPKVTLSEIFRQARNSRIIVNAHRINAGKMPHMEPDRGNKLGDFYFIEQENPEKILTTILTLVGQRIPQRFGFDAVEDIQVLSPMHRGIIGAENLNRRLQQTLNPQEAYVGRAEQRYGLHDKVMQVRNNYDKQVFNGDIGRITRIDPSGKSVTVRFDNRHVPYAFDEMDEVVLAYAISIHKSQGSEYPAVVIPVTTGHYLLLQRNLIYTGITRARQLAVVIGTRKAMAIGVRNNTPQRRYTGLARRLSEFERH